jgi:hypothetical protein
MRGVVSGIHSMAKWSIGSRWGPTRIYFVNRCRMVNQSLGIPLLLVLQGGLKLPKIT